MSRRFRCATLIIVAAVTPEAFSYHPDYGPFLPGQEPRRFQLAECRKVAPDVEDVVGNQLQYTFGIQHPGGESPRLRLQYANGLCYLTVLDVEGHALAGPQPVSDEFGMIRAHYADLNMDGCEDFVTSFWHGGCGLGFENWTTAFAISDKDTYRITVISTMSPGAEDFVDVDRDGRCEVVQASFVFNDAEHERDGRPHNYRVYHLLEIKDGKLIVSRKDRRFPCWIWYTFKPNHRPTSRLTPERKKALWDDRQIFWQAPAMQQRPEQGSDSAMRRLLLAGLFAGMLLSS